MSEPFTIGKGVLRAVSGLVEVHDGRAVPDVFQFGISFR